MIFRSAIIYYNQQNEISTMETFATFIWWNIDASNDSDHDESNDDTDDHDNGYEDHDNPVVMVIYDNNNFNMNLTKYWQIIMMIIIIMMMLVYMITCYGSNDAR